MTDENTMKIKCPHCKKTLTDDEIKIIWGQFVSSKTKGLTTEKKKKRVLKTGKKAEDRRSLNYFFAYCDFFSFNLF